MIAPRRRSRALHIAHDADSPARERGANVATNRGAPTGARLVNRRKGAVKDNGKNTLEMCFLTECALGSTGCQRSCRMRPLV